MTAIYYYHTVDSAVDGDVVTYLKKSYRHGDVIPVRRSDAHLFAKADNSRVLPQKPGTRRRRQ